MTFLTYAVACALIVAGAALTALPLGLIVAGACVGGTLFMFEGGE